MAGSSKELGLPKTNNSSVRSLKEQLARTTLRNVRSEGHEYVEIREGSKRPIFFCILCLATCYSDTVLHDHLRGRFHMKMYEAAKAILLKENRWPFNDGMLFFHVPCNGNDGLVTSNVDLLGNVSDENDSLAIVAREGNDESVEDDGDGYRLVIPGVLVKDKVTELEVRCIGVGQIGARYFEKDGVTKGLSRIWCEWVGDNSQDDIAPQHDFGIVSFSFDYDMGRKGLLDGMLLLPSSTESKKGKKRKSSDPDDVTKISSSECESHEEDGDGSRQVRVIKNRTVIKEMREHRRIASERKCDICQHKILPGKDVATLVNMKTGRIVCSSRNSTGAFHVFHISCLIHWVLFCEYEVSTRELDAAPKVKKRGRKKGGAKGVEEVMKKQICSPFCPECQGTGVDFDGDELEKPTVSLSEIHKYKMKACDGQKEYRKRPEMLENCSTGFGFPPPQPESEEMLQEHVSVLKVIRFFRAD